MAKMSYSMYLHNPDAFYRISNIEDGSPDSVTPETFKNPPIKMKIMECRGSLEDVFTIDYLDEDDPFLFRENYIKVLQGESLDWRLTGVSVGRADTQLYFTKATCNTLARNELILGESYDIQTVYCRPKLGRFLISFEVERAYDVQKEIFTVECGEITLYDKVTSMTTSVVEYRNGHKYRMLNVQRDTKVNPSYLGHPCTITEY